MKAFLAVFPVSQGVGSNLKHKSNKKDIRTEGKQKH